VPSAAGKLRPSSAAESHLPTPEQAAELWEAPDDPADGDEAGDLEADPFRQLQDLHLEFSRATRSGGANASGRTFAARRIDALKRRNAGASWILAPCRLGAHAWLGASLRRRSSGPVSR
jgi:hypothetical protein